MNKTTMFLALVTFAVVGMAGAVIVLIFRPESIATLTTLVTQILGLMVSAGVTFYGLGKVGDAVEAVRKQTNGTLSGLMAERDAALARLAQHDAEAAVTVLDKRTPDHRAEV